MSDPKIYRLNLYNSSEYEYHTVLNSTSFKLKFKYNTRMQKWIIGIGYSNGDPIVTGKVLYSNFPIYTNRIPELKGFFMLVPIGGNVNETISNPYEINKYYNFYYIDDDGFSNPDY